MNHDSLSPYLNILSDSLFYEAPCFPHSAIFTLKKMNDSEKNSDDGLRKILKLKG